MSITIPIIKNITLTVGETRVLRAIISPPNATNRNVSWRSDNEAVATVERGVVTHNATRALVTAKSPGTATITARIMDYRIREDNYIVNHEYTDTIEVTVIPPPKVSIEVGHGGNDPGTTYTHNGVLIKESDICLVVGLELKRQLERHGAEILISRETDVDDGAEAFFTGQEMDDFNPNIGISIHVNSGGGEGFESYHQTRENIMEDSLELCRTIAEEVGTIPHELRSNGEGRDLRDYKVENGENILKNINGFSGVYSYTELGFLDNPIDYARFDTEEKQKKFGTAYAKGILNFLGITWKSEN